MSDRLTVIDDTGHHIALERPARRIVSLVPSHSETVAALIGEDALVGITRYCVRPSGLPKRRMVVGGTKDPTLERIAALAPDLVVVNREENLPQHIAWLRERFAVYESATVTLDDTARTISDLGTLLGVPAAAAKMVRQLEDARGALAPIASLPRRKTLYLVWRSPYRAINGTTYIHHLLDALGLDNLMAGSSERYPMIDVEGIAALDPELVVLPDEPFPFSARHARALAEELRPHVGTMPLLAPVDGSACCWYGVRTATGLGELLAWRCALEMQLPSGE